MRMRTFVCAGAAFGALVIGCARWAHEGLDPAAVPAELRADYALFAQRCSKCHSLARPLSSGIDDDDYWVEYVGRMRRQPSSGISEDDTVAILRFLHDFSAEERLKKAKRETVPPVLPVPTPTATVPVPPAGDAGPIPVPPAGRAP